MLLSNGYTGAGFGEIHRLVQQHDGPTRDETLEEVEAVLRSHTYEDLSDFDWDRKRYLGISAHKQSLTEYSQWAEKKILFLVRLVSGVEGCSFKDIREGHEDRALLDTYSEFIKYIVLIKQRKSDAATAEFYARGYTLPK